MTITLTLTGDDYLTAMLYAASKKNSVKKARLRSWFCVTAIFLMFSLIFTMEGHDLAIFFGIMFVLSLCLYPFYLRHYYKKHYTNQVIENYQEKIGVLATIRFENDHIFTADDLSETKFNLAAVKEINEIGTHIFIQLRAGTMLILPKRAINVDEFWDTMDVVMKDYEVATTQQLGWKWS